MTQYQDYVIIDTESGLCDYHMTMVLQLPSLLDISSVKCVGVFIDSLLKNLLIQWEN